jgi:hypothetical protein
MIETFLKRNREARALVAVPLRDRKTEDLAVTFQKVMTGIGFTLLVQGQDVCRDDWEVTDEEGAGVVCWWAIWSWDIIQGVA